MYSVIRLLLRLILSVFFRWDIKGKDYIPQSGPVIIASNHLSNWDPPLIGCAIYRPLRFMAKDELFKIGAFGWLITKLGAFPVRRGVADRTAIRMALNLLENGEVLGVFPEGTRSKTGELGTAEPGVAMLALKSGATVIPAAITGTNRVFSEGQLLPQFKLRFGKPIVVQKGKADKEAIDSLSLNIMADIKKLMAEG